MLRLLLTALGALALDLATKIYVRTTMDLWQEIVIIPRVFSITHIENPGAAFGMLANQRWFFVIVAIAVIVLVLMYAREAMVSRSPSAYALGMMLGGAVGNLIDRLRTGLVTDFFEIKGFPVFNVADTFIVTGVGLFILLMWRSRPDEATHGG